MSTKGAYFIFLLMYWPMSRVLRYRNSKRLSECQKAVRSSECPIMSLRELSSDYRDLYDEESCLGENEALHCLGQAL